MTREVLRRWRGWSGHFQSRQESPPEGNGTAGPDDLPHGLDPSGLFWTGEHDRREMALDAIGVLGGCLGSVEGGGAVSESSSWSESRDVCPGDLRLRRSGFRIHARPKFGSVMWSRGGELFTESEAHAVCRRESGEIKSDPEVAMAEASDAIVVRKGKGKR